MSYVFVSIYMEKDQPHLDNTAKGMKWTPAL